MYKLLIVDDEKIEREGMAELISWEEQGIEVAGTAWNGQDGYEKALKLRPDIVLTDIKMPVMDGIELIRRLHTELPDTEIIVLSGYGDYEYTSQVMEFGIKYYILKPCDEGRIIPVFEKVTEEIRKKRGEQKEYNRKIKKLLPLAKEQVFRNILLNREISRKEYQMFLEEMGSSADQVRLLGFRNPSRRFDALEQFVMENVLAEMLGGNQIYMGTSVSEDVLFLIHGEELQKIEKSTAWIRAEFAKVNPQQIQTAVSNISTVGEAGSLYTQIRELFRIGSMTHRSGLLSPEMYFEYSGNISEIFRYKQIWKAPDYAGVLFEVYLAFLKMELHKISSPQKKEICSLAYQIFCEEKKAAPDSGWQDAGEEDWDMLCTMTDLLAGLKGIDMSAGKEEVRIRQMLQAVYANLGNPELSIRYLAGEVLFMNEEYFGRIFLRYQNQKFSSWLRSVRIELAKCILAYMPEIKVSRLAELTGYSPDGQYFSKVFRGETGMTPTEYCEQLKNPSHGSA